MSKDDEEGSKLRVKADLKLGIIRLEHIHQSGQVSWVELGAEGVQILTDSLSVWLMEYYDSIGAEEPDV